MTYISVDQGLTIRKDPRRTAEMGKWSQWREIGAATLESSLIDKPAHVRFPKIDCGGDDARPSPMGDAHRFVKWLRTCMPAFSQQINGHGASNPHADHLTGRVSGLLNPGGFRNPDAH